MVKITSFGLSDVGLVRPNNEDAWVEVPEIRLFILADGMGGHQAGEIASQETVESLSRILKQRLAVKRKRKMHIEEAHLAIFRAIERTNHYIFKRSRSEGHLRGMGTTLCCLYVHDDEGVVFAHIGDSRIYRLRQKKLQQLTRDHSLLASFGMEQDVTAPIHSLYKNILTRAVGTEPTVVPTVESVPLIDQDLYLMCSDGLSDMLSQNEIEAILNNSTTIKVAGEALVEAAKEKGGIDNITVVLVQLHDLPR